MASARGWAASPICSTPASTRCCSGCSTQAALGTYAVAVNASEVLFYLPSAVGTALLPAVARMGADSGVDRTLRVFRVVMILTLAAVAIAAAHVGPVLLPLVFGHNYDGSVEPFLLLLPSALGFVASSVFSNALLASGAPALSSLGPVVSLIIGVALDLILIPSTGLPVPRSRPAPRSSAAASRRPSPTAGGQGCRPARSSRAAPTWSCWRASRCASPAPGRRSTDGARASSLSRMRACTARFRAASAVRPRSVASSPSPW